MLVGFQRDRKKRALARFLDYQCRNSSNQFTAGSDYAIVLLCCSICWFFDIKPPHQHGRETLGIKSDWKREEWNFVWEIIALYPENISEKQLDELEEWLLLDVTEDIQDAAKIRTQEVSEAFAMMDLSGLSEEQLRRMIVMGKVCRWTR